MVASGISLERGIFRIPFFTPSVLAICSSRTYGLADQKKFFSEAGVEDSAVRFVRQEHTDVAVFLDEKKGEVPGKPADAIFTNRRDIALAIKTADCIPVFVAFEEPAVIGLIHAGWRGLRQKIIRKAVSGAAEQWKVRPDHIQIAFGPSIRKCCYRVTPEFKEYFPGFYSSRDAESGFMDMISAAYEQLKSIGVQARQVWDSGICTFCSNGQFFSARREKGTPERIFSLMKLK